MTIQGTSGKQLESVNRNSATPDTTQNFIMMDLQERVSAKDLVTKLENKTVFDSFIIGVSLIGDSRTITESDMTEV